MALPVIFGTSRNRTNLGSTLSGLYTTTSTTVTRNGDLVVLSSQSVDTSRTPVPTLLTITKLRRRLVHGNDHAHINLILRSNRPHRIRRFTALVNCNYNTVGPCLIFSAVRNVVSSRLLPTVSFSGTYRGFVGTIAGKIVGVTSGVNVSAVRDCHKTRVFRTLNLGRSIVSRCFA